MPGLVTQRSTAGAPTPKTSGQQPRPRLAAASTTYNPRLTQLERAFWVAKGRSMKVYRKARAASSTPTGTSSPDGRRSASTSALALTPVRFSLPSFFRWLQRLLFRLSTMTKTTSPTTKSDLPSSTPTGTSEKSNTSTPSNTSNAASPKGPWNRPELNRSPDYVLATLQETKHMIASLQEKENA